MKHKIDAKTKLTKHEKTKQHFPAAITELCTSFVEWAKRKFNYEKGSAWWKLHVFCLATLRTTRVS